MVVLPCASINTAYNSYSTSWLNLAAIGDTCREVGFTPIRLDSIRAYDAVISATRTTSRSSPR